jgi:hypothetical protein
MAEEKDPMVECYVLRPMRGPEGSGAGNCRSLQPGDTFKVRKSEARFLVGMKKVTIDEDEIKAHKAAAKTRAAAAKKEAAGK